MQISIYIYTYILQTPYHIVSRLDSIHIDEFKQAPSSIHPPSPNCLHTLFDDEQCTTDP